MPKRTLTVQDLASQSGVDTDEVLLTLWEEGLDYLVSPTSRVRKLDTARAKRAIGMAGRRELRSASYWSQVFELDDAGIQQLLLDLGLTPLRSGPGLPKKAVSRLRAEARRRGIDPTTGARLVSQDLSTIERKSQSTSEPAPEVFQFKCVGHERELRYLTPKELEEIHHALVEDFSQSSDPIEPPGIRSRPLLESACHRPETSLGGVRKYATIESAAAALLHSVVLNHPFHNGNKRAGLVAMLAFMDENGLYPTFDQDSLFKMVLQVAQHRIVDPYQGQLADREVHAVSIWIHERSRLIEKGDRTLQWRKLKRILARFDCTFEHASVGNRLNIERRTTTRGRFGRERTEIRSTQVAFTDDGRDCDVSVVKKIRADLMLDEPSGVDSQLFYSKENFAPGDFILRYRKTLRRLARL